MKHKYRATSYSMGRPVEAVTFEANSNEAALMHPAITRLPIAGQGQGGKRARIVGIKRIG